MKEILIQCSAKVYSAKDNNELFFVRLWLEALRTEVKKIIGDLDKNLMENMKKENISSFESGFEDNKYVISWGRRKKTKVYCAKMAKYLFSGSEPEKEMAREALSSSQSAWKSAKVQIMADTLGVKDLITTEYEDKIELKAIPLKIFEGSK